MSERDNGGQVRLSLVLFALLAIVSCAGPEPSDTGYVVLDPAARAAGLTVDTGDGTGPRSSSLPIAVSASEGATLVGSGLRAPLVVAPGETIEVKDAHGTLVRGVARADRLVIAGDREQAAVLAQMLGAQVVTRSDGRVELVGDDVLFAAALYGDLAGIDAVSVLLAGASTESDALWTLGRAPAAAAAMAISEGQIGGAEQLGNVLPLSAVLDPASLVGLYETGNASLLIDAAGGYRLQSGGADVRGTWSVVGGGLVLVRAGQASGVTMRVTADVDELRDPTTGLVLRTAPGVHCRIPARLHEEQ